MVNVIGVVAGFLMVFTFYISGKALKSLLNIKNENPWTSIILGFFTFFAFITITTLPFQFFNILIKSYIYILFGLTIIYIVMSLILIRAWFTTEIIGMRSVQYFIALIIVGSIVVLAQAKVEPKSSDYESAATLIFHRLLQIDWGYKLHDIVNVQDRSLFYMIEYMVCSLFDHVHNIQLFIRPFWYIVTSFLWASLYVEMFGLVVKEKRQLNRWIIFVCGLGVFIGLLLLVALLGISTFSGDEYFVMLIIYICVVITKHVGARFPQQNTPIIIGMALGSYMSFSSENTYPILFLLYAFIFLMQLRSKVGYFREISRMSWLVLIEFIIYNIVSRLWIQSAIFGGLFLIVLFLSVRSRSKYYLDTKIELYLQQRNVFAILLLPIILFIISAAYSLANDVSIVPKDVKYLQIILWWFESINNSSIKSWVVFLTTMIVLGLAIAWVFIRQRIPKGLAYSALDIFFILYLTFYNPFFTRTIESIEPSINLTAGFSLISIAFVIVAVLPFEIANFIGARESNTTKLIINLRPNRLSI